MIVLAATHETPASPQQQRDAAGRLLARGLARAFGVRPDELVFERNSFGKPSLAGRRGVHFSVAHCPDAVAVAVADRPVGVDVERIRPRDRYVAARCLDASERERVEAASEPDREFFRYWTLKESYVKALGCGLTYPLRKARFAVTDGGEVASDRPNAAFLLVEGHPRVMMAVCRLGGAGAIEPQFVPCRW